VNVLLLEELPVNDQLVPAQLEARVLSQQTDERFLGADEEFQQFIVVDVAGGDEQRVTSHGQG
jgi:hypothetical protein